MVAPVPAQITKLRLPPRPLFTLSVEGCSALRALCVALFSFFQRSSTPTPLLPITSLQPEQFHAITHSFAQWRTNIPTILNSLRTLSIVTGVYPSPFPSSDFQTSRRAKSFVCIGLLPLCLLSAVFSALASFVFNRLEPLSTKHPGWGTSHALPLSALTLRSLRLSVVLRSQICPSFVFILLQIPFLLTLFFSHPCKTPGGVCTPSRPFYSCRASSMNPRYNRAAQFGWEGS
jgi:hypothetical protein